MRTVLSRAEQQSIVSRKVQELLGASRAYQSLPAAERARIFADTSAVVERLAANGGPPAVLEAVQPDDPWAQPLDATAPTPPATTTTTGSTTDFGAGIEKGVQQAGQILREVNFPDFVSSLIKGVFQAIVDASIQQMKAYGELVQGVAMSLNDFRDQNVTDNQARDHLIQKYPGYFQLDVKNGQPTVGVREGADTGDLPNFKSDLGLDDDVSDLDPETIEATLLPAAKTQVALGRQKLLATMVLMGINRIIVTDGKINAKLKFNFTASDSMQGTRSATKYDNLGTQRQEHYTSNLGMGEGGASNWVKDRQSSEVPIIRVADQSDSTTKADLQASAQLAGEVSVNFRSETFPLEKMVNTDQLTQLQAAGAGRAAPAPGALPATAPAAVPPPPTPAAVPAAPAH